jgi:hypothetical protein
MKLYSLPQAAKLLGQTYDRIYYAIATQKVKAMQAGRSRLLTDADLATLRKLFSGRTTK